MLAQLVAAELDARVYTGTGPPEAVRAAGLRQLVADLAELDARRLVLESRGHVGDRADRLVIHRVARVARSQRSADLRAPALTRGASPVDRRCCRLVPWCRQGLASSGGTAREGGHRRHRRRPARSPASLTLPSAKPGLPSSGGSCPGSLPRSSGLGLPSMPGTVQELAGSGTCRGKVAKNPGGVATYPRQVSPGGAGAPDRATWYAGWAVRDTTRPGGSGRRRRVREILPGC